MNSASIRKLNLRYGLFCLIILCGSLAAMGQGIISHPTKKSSSANKEALTRSVPPPKVIVYEHANYQGTSLIVNSNTALLPPPLGSTEGGKHGNVSSLKVNVKGWVILWEGKEYNEREDQLWVEGPAVISDLSKLHREHGNNHWGDRIRAISFSGTPPTGDNSRRTIISRRTTVR